jgi:ABC-type multidrug transport system ATPase subunit
MGEIDVNVNHNSQVLSSYDSICRVVAFLAKGEILTEGQIANLIGTNLVAVRIMVDDGVEMLQSAPPKGQWAEPFMKKVRDA